MEYRKIRWLRDFVWTTIIPVDAPAERRVVAGAIPVGTTETAEHLFKKGSVSEILVEPHRMLTDGHFDIMDQARVGEDFELID